jgi:hypothetical protein
MRGSPVRGWRQNTFGNAELINAQIARVTIRETFLPVQIVIKSRTRPAGFSRDLTPRELTANAPQSIKADKHGFPERLHRRRENSTLIRETG